MDEKTDALPSGDPALGPDSDGPVGDPDISAGTDNDASLLSDSVVSSEPATEVEPESVVGAEESLSTDANVPEPCTSENAISTEVATSETSTLTYTSESVATDVSKTEGETEPEPEPEPEPETEPETETETSSSPAEKEDSTKEVDPAKDDVSAEAMEVEEADNSDLKEDNLQESADPSAAVCQLEEELKRLHGGDSEEEQRIEKPEEEITLKSLLKETDFVEEKKLKTDGKSKLEETPIIIKKNNEKPIMKDSDLEEMLSASADDIFRDPELIKEAQDDIKTTDVLICGKCHEVYHFVEEFQTHKSQSCSAKSSVVSICEGESKPQVWGFTLWKNKQHKMLKPGEAIPSSWFTYQKWCKLAPIDKNAWISAGQALQFCQKIGSAKILIDKPKLQVKIEKDPLSLDSESNKENSMDNSLMRVTRSVKVVEKPELNNKALRTLRTSETKEYAVERIVAKRFNPKKKCWEYQIKWEHFPNDDNTWEPVTNLTHCKKMVEEFEEQLKKLKAEKAKQQQQLQQPPPVTPQSAVKSRKVANATTPLSPTPSSSSSLHEISGGRPTRTSKQKALNQVKAWCGNISDDESGSMKRKADTDSDDSYGKRLKYEGFSDDSDTDIKPNVPQVTPKVTSYRKIAPKPTPTQQPIQIIRNGIDKLTPIPSNVLIPDANGVVRINQKQLPSLSTGVYIMSKTAGIIKLDSATSKVATSGGQTIVKVAPKIGQTQIKIVKKDGSTGATKQMIQTLPNTSTPTRLYKPIITKVKKPAEVIKKTPEPIKKSPEVVKRITEIVKKAAEPMKRSSLKSDISMKPMPGTPKLPIKVIKSKEDPKADLSPGREESDDGLEELPFPEEIKMPEPEEEPDEFSLDPFTGKLAGVEYPDIPEPEPEPIEEAKSDTSLDNIVKLAAADITEEDLKNDSTDVAMDLEPVAPEPRHEELEEEEDEEEVERVVQKMLDKKRIIKSDSQAASRSKTIIRMPVGPRQTVQRTPTSSILNKVLTGTPIIRRPTTSPQTVSRIQHRVLNQSVGRSPVATVVRVGNTTYVRKPITQKRYVQANVIRGQHDSPAKNVYTYSRPEVQTVTRKIGNTTIRSTNMGTSQQTSPRSGLIAQRPAASAFAASTPRLQARVVQTSTSVPKVLPRKDPMGYRQPEKKLVMTSKVVMPKPIPSHQALQAATSSLIVASPKKPKQVISMPSLLGDDEEPSPELPKSSSPEPTDEPTDVTVTPIIETQGNLSDETEASDNVSTVVDSVGDAASTGTAVATPVAADLSSFTLADNENPIFITGDDGTVYQVAGQNEQGQTILLTQGSDGQQQCLLVTSEVAETMETNAEEPQQQQQQQQTDETSMPDISDSVTEPLSIKTDAEANDQVVAQVVRAEPPSPGGTHKVVVMLPDGNLMVTQVSPEEYASLELE